MTDLPDEATDAETVDDRVDEPAAELDEERREALLQDTPEETAARAVGLVETGNASVDEVIASLEGLDNVPVDEHVALFEQAHEQLRRTLSGAGENQS